MARRQPLFLFALFVLLVAAAPPVARAVLAPETWDPAFGLPGVNGDVYAVIEFEGDLVIGGNFTGVGGLAVPYLARWNGSYWAAMGSPLDGAVYALEVWNGELYAGGEFSEGLVQFDGDWSGVDGGVYGIVEALTVWNGNLAVGGYFDSAGDGNSFLGNVTVWDGSFWDELDGGVSGDVYDLASFGGSLYACGSFDDAGGNFVQNLARWSGAGWSGVGGGLSDFDFDPYNAYGTALAVQGGQLVVGGSFGHAGGLAIDNLVGWNGVSFGPVGSQPAFGEITALGLQGTDLVCGDIDGNLERWNGTFWSYVGWCSGGALDLGDFGGDLVLGGSFSTVAGVPAWGLALYDGAWSALADGQGAVSTIESVYDWNGTPIAGGRMYTIGTVNSLIAAWDGAAWQPLGAGIPYSFGSYVGAMVGFEDDLIVGGSFSNAGGIAVNKVARWDGTAWSAMGAGSASGVSGLIVLDGELYANGHWSGVQTLGHWNGSDFDPLGATGIGGGVQILYGLGSYQGDPVMGGAFTSVDGVAAANIARWDGAAWQPLGLGVGGSVQAIHEMGGKLYVGGGFTQAGGAPATNIAVWDGTSWSPLGDGLYGGRVFGITSIGSDLYATGEFTQAGGQPCSYVARWDGTAWHTLDTGLDAEGHVCTAIAGQLWVGGEFQQAGSTISSRIARWQPGAVSAAPLTGAQTRIALRPAYPNPFTGTTALAFELAQPARVTIDVYDLRGARVRTFDLAGMSAGPHHVSWDGRDDRGRAAPSGVYFVALRGEEQAARQRVVLLR